MLNLTNNNIGGGAALNLVTKFTELQNLKKMKLNLSKNGIKEAEKKTIEEKR